MQPATIEMLGARLLTMLLADAGMEWTSLAVRIMVVDGDESILEFVGETLTDEGQVAVALSGVEALELIERTPPDLIMLDMRMPVMDGWELEGIASSSTHSSGADRQSALRPS